MQGRCTKIWFANIHYADDTIMHKDTRLNFCIEDPTTGDLTEALNGLISLENGDGKGLILQLFTNLFDPMAEWKGGKNKIEHLFYNSKGKPINYTGYVIGEFDVGGDRRLMIGMALTPRIMTKEQQREEQSEIVVDYIQFVREYSVEEEFDIYELPILNVEDGDAISIAEFKKMIDKEYKDEIEIITVNNRGAYTQLLHSYGYTTSSIANMKQINQKEGSVEAYFSNAMTNEGLFFQKIIPTINDELQNTDSTKETSDLITSFLDTVKIAKDLPEMLEISESAEIIKEMLNPIRENLMQGLCLEEEKDVLKKRGYAIKEKLAEVYHSKKRESEIKQNQIQNQKDEIQTTKYHMDNADYGITNKAKLVTEKELLKIKDKIQANSDILKQLKIDAHTAAIHRNLKHFDFYQNQIDLKFEIKSELEQSLEHQELVEKLKKLRKEIQQRWEQHILPAWKKVMASGEHYILKLRDEVAHLKNEEIDLVDEKADRNSNKKDLKNSIQNHKVKLDEMITKKFGEKVRFDLPGVIKSAEEGIVKYENVREERRLELATTRTSHSQCIGELWGLGEKKNEKHKELENILDEMERTKEVEELVEDELNRFLKESSDELKSRSWFLRKKAKLIEKVNEYMEKMNLAQRKYWDLEGDIELLNESRDFDVWIPNKDVLSLKKKLVEQGIKCIMGSELLSTKSFAERKKELDKNPLIPYSVILFKDDLAQIDFSVLQEELHQYMVPLIVRQDMKDDVNERHLVPELRKVSVSAYVHKNKGYQLIEEEEAWEYWKVEIESTATDLEKEMNSLTQLVEEGQWVGEQLNNLLSGKVLEELLADKEQAEKDVKAIEQNIEDKEVQKGLLEKEIAELEQQEEELLATINKEKDNVRELLSWKVEVEVNEKNIFDLMDVESKIEVLQKQLEHKRSEIKDTERQTSTFQNELRKWENNANNSLRKIQVPAVGASFPTVTIEEIKDATSQKPSLSEVIDPQSELLLETYNNLDAEEGSSNVKISMLNSEINSLNQSKNAHIIWLNQNAGDWEGTPIPEDTVNEIEEKENLIQEKLDEVNKHIQEFRITEATIAEKLKQYTDTLKKQRNAILERHGREPEYISELDYEVEKLYFAEKLSTAVEILKEWTFKLEDLVQLMKDIRFLSDNLLLDGYIERSSFVLSEEENRIAGEDPERLVKKWGETRAKSEDELNKFKDKLKKEYNRLLIEIDKRETISSFVREPFKNIVLEIQSSRFQRAVAGIENIIFWAEKEVEKRAESKKQCDEAIRFFTERCTKRAQDVITGLKVFVNKMKVKNEDGDFVELVRFEKSYRFPDNKVEIEQLIKEYCEQIITNLVKKHPNAENIKIKDVEPMVNISRIMKVVLGKFPKLHIYIPDGTSSLLSERPKEHLYKEWEVVNNGGNRSSSKSGGQTIMAHMILISMLQKKGNDDNWTMVVTDNLFGAMSAKKLVQPVFAVLEMLKVQWITVVPANAPVQITSNFNVVYLLSVDYKKGKGIVTYEMEKYERRYLHRLGIVDDLKKKRDEELDMQE